MDCFVCVAQRDSAATVDDDAPDAALAPAAAHIIRQRQPQYKPGWTDKAGMLAKLKVTTNIGDSGLIVLYLESSYFVRDRR